MRKLMLLLVAVVIATPIWAQGPAEVKIVSYDEKAFFYTPLARQASVDGVIVVRFEVDAEGKASKVEILSGHPLLREAALKALQSVRFACPNCAPGMPIRKVTQIRYSFKGEPSPSTKAEIEGSASGFDVAVPPAIPLHVNSQLC